MAKIVLSSGIRGSDWQESVNAFSQVSDSIEHSDNVMLTTNGKFDELLIQTDISDSQLKSAKKQFKQHLAKLSSNKKSLIHFYSDPDFINSGNVWNDINSSNTFLFYFCTPEYYLAKCQEKVETLDKQEALDNWLEDATKIWDFYTQFPDNTHLINIADVGSDIISSVKTIATSLEIKKLNISSKDMVKMEMSFEQLSFLLSQSSSLIETKDNNALQDLFDNLLMVSVMADDHVYQNRHERAAQLIEQCYQLSIQLKADNSQIKIVLDERTEQRDEQANKYQENTKVVIELTKQNDNLLATTDKQSAIISKLEDQNVTLENNASDFTAANELSLLQINQLQEELEVIYTQSNALKNQNHELVANTKNQSAIISKLEGQNVTLENNTSALTTENKLSLLQISQLQEELESIYIESKQQLAMSSTLEAKISELGTKNSQLKTSSNEQVKKIDEQTSKHQENKKIAVELKKQIADLLDNTEKQSAIITELERQNTKLENNASECMEANELSLLQIYQLQEELEATHIQTAQQEALNLKLEAKITELGSNNLRLQSVGEEHSTENELCLLQINQLQEELEFHYTQYQKATYSSTNQNNYQVDLNCIKGSLTLMSLI